MINCALIPNTLDDPSMFHQCLLSYMSSSNIHSELNEAQPNNESSANCDSLKQSISAMVDGVYDDVEKNLNDILENKTEVDCLMETFRINKFLEINIVLTAAHLTTGKNDDDSLKEVFSKSKSIFTFATMKCIFSDQILMDIFEDFSSKVHVNQEELQCVKIHLTKLKLLKVEVTTILPDEEHKTPDTDYDETTVASTREEESTTLDPTEDGETQREIFVQSNQIFKLSSEESSAEEPPRTPADDACDRNLFDLQARITNFKFPSMNDEQNQCMANQSNEIDVNAVYEFIVLRTSSTTQDEINERNEKLKDLIVGYIWKIIDCTDIFGFTGLVDNLLQV